MSLIKTYLHFLMTQMTDNIIDRDELQDMMIQQILDDMDIKTTVSYTHLTLPTIYSV